MALSETRRQEIVADLVSNGCCWNQEDTETLLAFNDETLEGMLNHADQADAAATVANAALAGFTDSAGNTHAYNQDSQEWVSDCLAASEGEECEEEPVANQTADEWIESAPTEIQSAVRNAMDIENREKAGLIEQMTANTSEEEKPGILDLLSAKPLSELRQLSVLKPKSAIEDSKIGVMNYLGAAAPVANRQSDDFQDDILPLPTADWSTAATN